MHVLLSGGQIIQHVRQNSCGEVEEAAESCTTDGVQGVPFRHITASDLRHLSLRPELTCCSVVSHVSCGYCLRYLSVSCFAVMTELSVY